MHNIALFPLNLVLFPGTILPLRIFETRYVDLVSECLREDTGFGICAIREGSEVGGGAICYETGTYGKIIDWTQLDDGLLGITVEAQKRFQVQAFSERRNKLLEGEIIWLEDDAVPTDESFALLQALLQRILEHYEIEVAELNDKLSDAAWLSYRLAEYLPLDSKVKQGLLETHESVARLTELERLLGDNKMLEIPEQ